MMLLKLFMVYDILYIGESINKIYPDAFINSGRLIEQIYIYIYQKEIYIIFAKVIN